MNSFFSFQVVFIDLFEGQHNHYMSETDNCHYINLLCLGINKKFLYLSILEYHANVHDNATYYHSLSQSLFPVDHVN